MNLGRILVVEDNTVNQKVAAAMLDKMGYQVDVVTDGLQAVEALTRSTYAAVLMDCHMPGMDGYEATEEIRRREGDARHTPVIAMTAAVTKEDRDRALGAGMDDFIPKPVEMERLISVLARWVGSEQGASGKTSSANDPDSTAGEVIDQDRVAELRGLGEGSEEDVFGELVRLFVRSSLEGLPRLQRAAAEGEAEALRDEAHRLRGAAANIGASKMASLCGQLEGVARTGNVDRAATLNLARRVEEEFDRARTALGSGS